MRFPASQKHVLFKMKMFESLKFFFNLNDTMNSVPSKDDNCSPGELFNFQHFQLNTIRFVCKNALSA